MTLNKKVLSLVAVWVLTAGASVSAAPVVSLVSPSGPVTVGSQVVFTVSDQLTTDGLDVASDMYVADLQLDYDAAFLQYLGIDITGGGISAGIDVYGQPNFGKTPPDADPNGHLNFQIIGGTSASLPLALDLFTVSFRALASTAGGSPATVTLSGDVGSDGQGGPGLVLTPTSGTTEVTSAIPEPTTWALSGLALFAAFATRRRSR